MSIELNDKIVNYEALDVFRQILVGQLTNASSESIKTALQAKLGNLGNYTVEQIVGTPIEVQMPDNTYVVSLKQLLGAEVKRAKAAEATLTNDVSSLGTRMSTAESNIASNKNAIDTLSSFIGTDGASGIVERININEINIASNTSEINNLKTLGSPMVAGLLKIYSTTGTNTDGSINQKVVTDYLNLKAPLASPTFTGTPKAPTPGIDNSTDQIATTQFVQSAIDKKIAAADAMIFKGTIGSSGTVQDLPVPHTTGWAYKVVEAGNYAGQECEIGDMIVCLKDSTTQGDNDGDWAVIQTNIDGAVTGPESAIDGNIAIFDASTGKVIRDSGFTIETSVPPNAVFTDTTYTTMVGASSSKNGKEGLVPAPSAGQELTFLRADGKWIIPTDTKYSAGTGLTMNGTQFINMGVRSVTAGSTANVISINTGGTASSITINNVAKATNADYATKATQDGSGRVITDTYYSKSEIDEKLTFATASDIEAMFSS